MEVWEDKGRISGTRGFGGRRSKYWGFGRLVGCDVEAVETMID